MLSRPRAPADGTSVRSAPASARAAASALASPLTTTQICRAVFRPSKLSESRSGGGLGESRTAITVAGVATIAVAARGFAGRLATAKPGAGLLIVRGLETAAAGAIILFGVALLTGYMMSERMGFF